LHAHCEPPWPDPMPEGVREPGRTSRMKVTIFTTGGTIDKVYFDARSEFAIGAPQIPQILEEAGAGFEYELIELMHKDSLELTEADVAKIHAAVQDCDATHALITHGTDTMADTARKLEDIPGKTIVLTGALTPARFRSTDALFNIGMAVAAVQVCPPGVYLAMNGEIFPSGSVRKNRAMNRFEWI
jgi:L-asparaginase